MRLFAYKEPHFVSVIIISSGTSSCVFSTLLSDIFCCRNMRTHTCCIDGAQVHGNVRICVLMTSIWYVSTYTIATHRRTRHAGSLVPWCYNHQSALRAGAWGQESLCIVRVHGDRHPSRKEPTRGVFARLWREIENAGRYRGTLTPFSLPCNHRTRRKICS